MVLFGPELSHIVFYCTVWSSMVLHEISDNSASLNEITHNSIRNLKKNKKALNITIYHDIAKDDTRYLLLGSILYCEIARDSSFSNKLYLVPLLYVS